ncbi:putative transposon, En/Spm-like protein [Tanacetum coccineum]
MRQNDDGKEREPRLRVDIGYDYLFGPSLTDLDMLQTEAQKPREIKSEDVWWECQGRTSKAIGIVGYNQDTRMEVGVTSPGFCHEASKKSQGYDPFWHAEKPLYEGCPDFTKLSAIVKLLNLKGKYGASDKFFTELLGLIKKMLPAGNEMNDKDLTACRTCGTSRWKVDNKTKKVYENIPAKVCGGTAYFPIILAATGLFKIESISEDLRWHATRRIINGVLRHPADSHAWRTIDEKFPKIAKDTRNLRLRISADGVDINTGNRHHSVWPVLTVIYNLPPWLYMKRKFSNHKTSILLWCFTRDMGTRLPFRANSSFQM